MKRHYVYHQYPREVFDTGLPVLGGLDPDPSVLTVKSECDLGRGLKFRDFFVSKGTDDGKSEKVSRSIPLFLDSLNNSASMSGDTHTHLEIPPLYPDIDSGKCWELKIPQLTRGRKLTNFSSVPMSCDHQTEENVKIERVDAVDEEDAWDLALLAESRTCFAWESRHKEFPIMEKPYLSELGSRGLKEIYPFIHPIIHKQHMKEVRLSELIDSLIHLMLAVPSDLFPFTKRDERFHFNEKLYISEVTPETLMSYVDDFMICGQSCYRLSQLCSVMNESSTLHDGFTLRSIKNALTNYLQHFRYHVLSFKGEMMLCRLKQRATPLIDHIRFVSRLFGLECQGFHLRKGLELVSFLYQQTLDELYGVNFMTCLYFLKSALQPLFRYLDDWVYHGIYMDVHSEFFITMDTDSLMTRDETFWERGYILKDCSQKYKLPEFLKHSIDNIFVCGKSLNLIKLCDLQNPVCNIDDEHLPRFVFCLSNESLDQVENVCSQYSSKMAEKLQEKVNMRERSLMKFSTDRKDLKLRAKRTVEKRLKQWWDSVYESKVKEDIEKRKKFAELKSAIEISVEKHRRQQDEEKQADIEYMDRNMKNEVLLADIEEDIKRQTKEALIAYYADLEKDAMLRKSRALWRIKRHQMDDVRRQFFEDEQNILEDESNYESHATNVQSGLAVLSNDGSYSADLLQVDIDSPTYEREVIYAVDHTASSPNPYHTDDDFWRNVASTSQTDKISDFKEFDEINELANLADTNVEAGLIPKYDSSKGSSSQSTFKREQKEEDDELQTCRKIFERNVRKNLNFLNDNLDGDLNDISNNLDGGIVQPKHPQLSDNMRDIMYPESEDITHVSNADFKDFLVRRSKKATLNCGENVENDNVVIEPSSQIVRRGNASVESQFVNVDLIRKEKFQRTNVHGHSSDSVVQKLMYGESSQDSSTVPTQDDVGDPPQLPSSFDSSRTNIDSVDPLKMHLDDDDTVINTRDTDVSSTANIDLSESHVFTTRVMEESGIDSTSLYVPRPYSIELKRNDALPDLFKLVVNVERSDESAESSMLDEWRLTALLRTSVTTPLSVQMSVVNKCVRDYFLNDLHVTDHFRALHNFMFMADGFFSQTLCYSLFEQIERGGYWTRQTLTPPTLNSILKNAVSLSNLRSDSNSKRFTFVVSSSVPSYSSSYIDLLTNLRLHYQVDWPLNIIITRDCLTKYGTIFNFLLQLKCATWTLQEIWLHLKDNGKVADTSNSTDFVSVSLFRHEMHHFIKAIEEYIVYQLIHVGWTHFYSELSTADGVDSIRNTVFTYLDKALNRCLLSSGALPILTLIQELLKAVIHFKQNLTTADWTKNCDGSTSHPNIAIITKSFRNFQRISTFLYKTVHKMAEREYQSHLVEFLTKINFNDFYK